MSADPVSQAPAPGATPLGEHQARAMLQTALDAIVMMDERGRIVEFSSSAERTFGYGRDHALGRDLADLLIPGDERKRHRAGLATYLATGRAALIGRRVDVTAMRSDGSLFPAEVTITEIQVDGAHLFIGYIRDISDRARAHEERAALLAREREARVEAALDALLAMAEAIMLTAEERDAADAGSAGARLAELTRYVLNCRHVAIVAVAPEIHALRPVAIAGFSPADASRWWRQWRAGPRLSDRLEPEHIARLQSDDILVLDRTQGPFDPATALGRRMVLMVPLRITSTLTGVMSVDHGEQDHHYGPEEIGLVKAAGRLVALVIERERLIQERAEARASVLALRDANQRMEDFLAIAGHELRTPLTSVLGNAQLAAQWVGGLLRQDPAMSQKSDARLAQIETLLRRVGRQGRVLDRLVSELLDASRIEADRLDLHLAGCDLTALVREVVLEHQQQWPGRRIVSTISAPAAPAVVDAERIGQVVTNFLSNALKFSAGDRPIQAGLDAHEGYARIWVRDEGPGLPEEEQVRVWDRFYRVATVGHRSGSSIGLGLGLYISRTIVERHGGQVGVDSRPGRGATFWFTLPLAHHTAP